MHSFEIDNYTYEDINITLIKRKYISYLCLRECDEKIFRNYSNKKIASEQCKRVFIRQLCQTLKICLVEATRDEIASLKKINILGYRAPSASLITIKGFYEILDYLNTKSLYKKRKKSNQEFFKNFQPDTNETSQVDSIQKSIKYITVKELDIQDIFYKTIYENKDYEMYQHLKKALLETGLYNF